MPIPFAAIPAAVETVKDVASIPFDIAAINKNKRALSQLKQPFYRVQDQYFQNRNEAGQLATEGLPSAAKDYMTTEASRGLGTGIGAIQEQGGSPNDISKLFEGYDRSINRIGAEDAQAQIDNIRYFMNVNKDLAGQKTTQFLVNELQPYEEKVKQYTQNIGNAKQNLAGHANSAIGAGSALATSFENQDLLNRLFPKAGPQGKLSGISDPVELSGGTLQPAGMGDIGQRRSPNTNTGGEGDPTQNILDRYYEIENILKRGG